MRRKKKKKRKETISLYTHFVDRIHFRMTYFPKQVNEAILINLRSIKCNQKTFTNVYLQNANMTKNNNDDDKKQ